MTNLSEMNRFSTRDGQVTGELPLSQSGEGKPPSKSLLGTEKIIKTAKQGISIPTSSRSAFKHVPRTKSVQDLGANYISTSYPPKTQKISLVFKQRERSEAFGANDPHHYTRGNRDRRKTVSHGMPLIGNACMTNIPTITNTPSPEPSHLLTQFLKRADERLRLEWPRLCKDYGDLFSDEGLSTWYRNVNPDITKAIELLMAQQGETVFKRTPWQSIDQVNAVQLYLVSLGPQLVEKEIEIPVILTPEDIEPALKTLKENGLLKVNKSDDSNKEFINEFVKLFQQESNLNLNWLNSDFVNNTTMDKDKLLEIVRAVFIGTCDKLLGASALEVRDLVINVDYHLWPIMFRYVWGEVRHQNECIFQNFVGFIINKEMSVSKETGKVTGKIRDAAKNYQIFFGTAYKSRWKEWNMYFDYYYTICHIVVPRPSDDSSGLKPEDYAFYPLKFDEVLENLAKDSTSNTNVSNQTSDGETKSNKTDQEKKFEESSQNSIAVWIKNKPIDSLVKTKEAVIFNIFDSEFSSERYFQDYNGHLEKQVYWLLINHTYINLKVRYENNDKYGDYKYKNLVNGFVKLFNSPFKLKEGRVEEGLSSIRGWHDYLSSGGFIYIMDMIAELDSLGKNNKTNFCVEYYLLTYMREWFSRFKPMIATFQNKKRPVELMKTIGIPECETMTKFVDLICSQLEDVKEPTNWSKKSKKLNKLQKKQPDVIENYFEQKLKFGGPQTSNQTMVTRYNKTENQMVLVSKHTANLLEEPSSKKQLKTKRSRGELRRSKSHPTTRLKFKREQMKKTVSYSKRQKSQTPPPN